MPEDKEFFKYKDFCKQNNKKENRVESLFEFLEREKCKLK